MHQLAMFGMIERKLAHHSETFWIFLRRLDRERIRIGIPPRGWMDQGRVDAGLVHLVKQLLRRELRDLAVQAGRRHDRLRPDMHLGVDDLPRCFLRPVLFWCARSCRRGSQTGTRSCVMRPTSPWSRAEPRILSACVESPPGDFGGTVFRCSAMAPWRPRQSSFGMP